jgi:peptidoglycan/xylan/chitin deacetylase (PgdA/CDA1 family)
VTVPARALARGIAAGLGVVAAAAALAWAWPPLGVLPLGAGVLLLWMLVPQVLPGGAFVGGRRDGDAAALTFDDGPNGDQTRAILAVLRREGVPATFFLLGAAARRDPGLVRELVAAGHVVGSHGLSHAKLAFRGPAAVAREVEDAQAALVAAGAPPPRLFRAPHGFRSPFLGRVLARAGLRLCAWTAGVWDTDRPGADVIAARAARALRPGAVLLLHDGGPGADRSQTAAALPAIIAAARARGLRLVTLPELMGAAAAPARPAAAGGEVVA